MKKKRDVREKIFYYRYLYGINDRFSLSKDDNEKMMELINKGEPLPENIYRYKTEDGDFFDEFYYVPPADLTPQEISEYLTYQKLELLKKIDNSLKFFVVLTIIVIFVSLLANL